MSSVDYFKWLHHPILWILAFRVEHYWTKNTYFLWLKDVQCTMYVCGHVTLLIITRGHEYDRCHLPVLYCKKKTRVEINELVEWLLCHFFSLALNSLIQNTRTLTLYKAQPSQQNPRAVVHRLNWSRARISRRQDTEPSRKKKQRKYVRSDVIGPTRPTLH